VVLKVQSNQVTDVSESRHYPYGGVRWEGGTLLTDYRFTGERLSVELGLYQMGARWYDPYLNRWLSADTLVPEPGNPQLLNRYSYVVGNPLRHRDPSGHMFPSETITPWEWWYGTSTGLPMTGPGMTSLAVDLIPGIGDIKGVAEAFTGRDLFTGESLGAWRWLGLIGLSELRPLRHADEVLGLGSAVIKRADEWVAKYGVQATMDSVRQAAKNGDLVLPGLFRYTDEAMETIPGYQKHHLWPEALGGTKGGWAVYVNIQGANLHTGIGGIQNWVDQQLMAQTGLKIDELRAWANANPDQLLPMLREIYADLGIDFPY